MTGVARATRLRVLLPALLLATASCATGANLDINEHKANATVEAPAENAAKAVWEWGETNQGLGGWLGAFGSVLAVGAAWWLSRHEYRRDRKEAERADRALRTRMLSIIDQWKARMVPFDDAVAQSDWPTVMRFEAETLNDPMKSGATDLAFIPAQQWPSLEAYLEFKEFWIWGLRAIERGKSMIPDPTALATCIQKRDQAYGNLRSLLS